MSAGLAGRDDVGDEYKRELKPGEDKSAFRDVATAVNVKAETVRR